MTRLLILIPVFLLLAALVVFAVHAPRATPRPRSASSPARPASATAASPPSSARRRAHHRPRDRADRRHRASTPRARDGRRRRTCPPYVPPDPDTIGVTRRQFFNRSIIVLFGLACRASAPRCSPSCGPCPRAASARRSTSARSSDLQTQITAAKGFLLPGRGPHVAHELPRPTPSRRPRPSTASRCSTRWKPASSSSTRSARTWAAACRAAPRRSGSSARATARSTTRPARRRVALRLAAWIASRPRSPVACSTSTPAPSSRVRRSAPTPPARRPKAPTASEERPLMPVHRQPGRGRHGRIRHRRASSRSS